MMGRGTRDTGRGVALGLGVMLVAAAPAGAQDSAAVDSAGGIYTAEQARHGEDVFRRECGACHAAGEFKGRSFMYLWGSGTVYPLFDFLRTQMPLDRPGSLSAEQYAAVIAYILRLNDLPAGGCALPADPEALRAISMQPSNRPEP